MDGVVHAVPEEEGEDGEVQGVHGDAHVPHEAVGPDGAQGDGAAGEEDAAAVAEGGVEGAAHEKRDEGEEEAEVLPGELAAVGVGHGEVHGVEGWVVAGEDGVVPVLGRPLEVGVPGFEHEGADLLAGVGGVGGHHVEDHSLLEAGVHGGGHGVLERLPSDLADEVAAGAVVGVGEAVGAGGCPGVVLAAGEGPVEELGEAREPDLVRDGALHGAGLLPPEEAGGLLVRVPLEELEELLHGADVHLVGDVAAVRVLLASEGDVAAAVLPARVGVDAELELHLLRVGGLEVRGDVVGGLRVLVPAGEDVGHVHVGVDLREPRTQEQGDEEDGGEDGAGMAVRLHREAAHGLDAPARGGGVVGRGVVGASLGSHGQRWHDRTGGG